jgi:hypothetical protein
MATLLKDNKKGLTTNMVVELEKFVDKVKKGTITPFKKKTDRARKNLKKAKLIK